MPGPPSCLVLDFDGVIRHHHPVHEAMAARAAGLEPGAMARLAFDHELVGALVVGRITRAQWIERVAERSTAPEAVRNWLADRGSVDPAMRLLIAETRSAGRPVALLTNGTDATPQELRHHELDRAFDHVFNSSEIGVAKPDPAVYAHVCAALGLDPSEIVFFDDSLANVRSAQGFGIRAHRFESALRTRSQLVAHGLLARSVAPGPAAGRSPD